jgi:MFS transporter, FSR family, fosmidomycin resistance protein
MTQQSQIARPMAAVLIASHAIDDLYQGAVPALVPFLVAERHYGYVAASGITLAATLLSSVAQPVFGLLTDRRPIPWLVPAGMTLAGLGIGASGLARSYAATWLTIALSGLGVAIYHPESARLARFATCGSHAGMSWYSLGGNIGFAVGPILITPILARTGLSATPLLAIPALLGALAITALFGGPGHVTTPAAWRPAVRGGDNWHAFLLLSLVVTCRSIVAFGLSTFLALFVEQRLHAGTGAGEAALALLLAAGAGGTLAGGWLAGRWGRPRTIRLAYAVTFAGLIGLLWAPGYIVYAFAAIVGLACYVPFSLHVTLGQDYLPGHIGTASGVTLGLAVSIGGLAAPLIGALAQASSLQTSLALMLITTALAWAVSRHLPEPRHTPADIALPRSSPAGSRRHQDADPTGHPLAGATSALR